jgi:RNA polymerase sigma-70 factor (ECF subfamily)
MSAGGDGPLVEVLLTHLEAVHRLARHLAPPGVVAEDLVQETYLRALAAGAAAGEVADVRAWLLTICLNVVRNEARRRARHREQPLPAGGTDAGTGLSGAGGPGAMGGVAVEHDPALLAERAERRRAVGQALALLPDPQRDCVVLVDVVGCTAREAAELLGCPRGTVLARVHRGRRRLAELLEREGFGDDV